MSEDTQETEGPQLKVGKFSAKETKMILEEIERYLDENELSLEDICPELREEKKTITHPSLWNRLEEQMPMRSRAVRHHHLFVISFLAANLRPRPEKADINLHEKRSLVSGRERIVENSGFPPPLIFLINLLRSPTLVMIGASLPEY
jgi:hypothetical protein